MSAVIQNARVRRFTGGAVTENKLLPKFENITATKLLCHSGFSYERSKLSMNAAVVSKPNLVTIFGCSLYEILDQPSSNKSCSRFGEDSGFTLQCLHSYFDKVFRSEWHSWSPSDWYLVNRTIRSQVLDVGFATMWNPDERQSPFSGNPGRYYQIVCESSI